MIAFRVTTLPSVGSTSDIVRERALAGEPEGFVVRAEEQRAGRGRHGRVWASPPGNLYASVLLRPKRPLAETASLSLLTALALAQALADAAPSGLALELKWPNDVLIGGAKLAGILLESLVSEASTPVITAGLGVNVAFHPDGLPYPATHLAEHGVKLDAEAVLERFLARFAVIYDGWQAAGFAPFRDAWLRHGHGLGGMARVRAGEKVIEGRFVDLDDEGRLVIETSAGRRVLNAGELFFAPAS